MTFFEMENHWAQQCLWDYTALNWDDVTAEMMTEEEMGSEHNYIRHRQSWCSLAFNQPMDKLDDNRNSNSGRLSLAKPRDLGDSVLRSPPPNAKVTLPTTSQAVEE